MDMEPNCPKTRRMPGSKFNSTRSVPCAGTIRDPDGTGPACTHCRIRFSPEEVAALAKAQAHPVAKPRRHTAEQLSMLADIV